ncbi:hypothetical protein [Aurantivibrio infirmus]
MLGLTVWPIENFATLYYLLFFLPSIIFLVGNFKLINRLFRNIDRKLFFSTILLLALINTSAFWNEDKSLDVAASSFKITVMIFLFVLITAIITRYTPRVFPTLIYAIVVLVSILGIFTLIHHIEYIQNKQITTRILQIGHAPALKVVNAATTGIYLGAIALFSIILLRNNLKNKLFFSRASIPFLVFILILFVLICWTRSVFLGLYVTFLICAANEKKGFLLVIAIAAPIASLILTFLIDSPQIESIINRGGDWRIQIWTTYIDSGLKDFWLGKGFLYNSDLTVSGMIDGNAVSVIHPHSHNFYIQLLYWLGFTGLSIYIYILIRVLNISFTNWTKFEAKIAFSVICYFMVVQVFDVYNIFTKPSYYWPCIWLPIGICFGIEKKYNHQKQPSG